MTNPDTPNLSHLKNLAMGTPSSAPAVRTVGSDYTPPPKKKLSNTTEIDFKHETEDGAIYRARVTYTVPTAQVTIAIGRIKSMIAPGGISGDATAAQMVEVVAYLTGTIEGDTLPSWWDPMASEDFDPYVALYREVNAYANRFHRGDADSGAASGDSPSGESDALAESPASERSVERRVQAPAKRSEVLVSDAIGGDRPSPIT